MKKLSWLISLACSILIVAAPAHGTLIDLIMFLDGEQSGTDSPATGFGTASLDTLTNLFSWNISFTDALLKGPETVAHFHGPAPAGVSAGAQITLPLGTPKTGAQTVSAQQAADILDELWYVNVHTSVHPGGEIRGQVTVVPEPATCLLLGAGLVPFLRRRRG